MEEKILIMAQEAFPHIELRRLREARKKIEHEPKPEKPTLTGWAKEVEKQLREGMKATARVIVNRSLKDVDTTFTPDRLKENTIIHFNKNMPNETPPLTLIQYLPDLEAAMEEVLLQKAMNGFNSRFEDLDGHIRNWEAKKPKPFSPEMINVDKRFPISRCRELQGRYYDVWLTEALKAKPIFFDSPDYVEKLSVFYETVYKPMAEVEQREKEPPPVSVQEKADGGDDPTLFANRHPPFHGGVA